MVIGCDFAIDIKQKRTAASQHWVSKRIAPLASILSFGTMEPSHPPRQVLVIDIQYSSPANNNMYPFSVCCSSVSPAKTPYRIEDLRNVPEKYISK